MLENIEFYNSPDGAVCVKPLNEPMFVYTQDCKQLTEEMISIIRDRYPEAFNQLSELYSKSEKNKDYFEYKIVHRFLRCNFGEYDALNLDISKTGAILVEDVRCPLRGECIYEGVICKPRLKTALSQRELEVAELLGKGYNRMEIANELQISVFTVSRHIANIKARLHFTSTSQIIAQFHAKDN